MHKTATTMNTISSNNNTYRALIYLTSKYTIKPTITTGQLYPPKARGELETRNVQTLSNKTYLYTAIR
jgi:hypothetical protein